MADKYTIAKEDRAPRSQDNWMRMVQANFSKNGPGGGKAAFMGVPYMMRNGPKGAPTYYDPWKVFGGPRIRNTDPNTPAAPPPPKEKPPELEDPALPPADPTKMSLMGGAPVADAASVSPMMAPAPAGGIADAIIPQRKTNAYRVTAPRRGGGGGGFSGGFGGGGGRLF